MREERVIGTVTTEARMDPETGTETQGRISYENRGECFFLPFTMNDVEGNVTVAAGDKVSFQMATMARSGNLVARTIRLENPASPVKYQGVVNSIQEDKTFGFIERADVVREIFFRYVYKGHLFYKVRHRKVNKVIWLKSIGKMDILNFLDYFHVPKGMAF